MEEHPHVLSHPFGYFVNICTYQHLRSDFKTYRQDYFVGETVELFPDGCVVRYSNRFITSCADCGIELADDWKRRAWLRRESALLLRIGKA